MAAARAEADGAAGAGGDGGGVVVSESSKAYAKLFLEEASVATMPLSEVRRQSVEIAHRVGGTLVPLPRIDDVTLPTADGRHSFPVRVYWPPGYDESKGEDGDGSRDGDGNQDGSQGGGASGGGGADGTTERGRRRKLGVVLHSHGGGGMIGCIESYDHISRRLAAQSGAVVVSCGYRLTPEHVWPAGLDDVETTYRWIVQDLAAQRHPDLLDPERVAVVGDSAGGHLCATLSIRLHRLGDLPPRLRPKAQVLIYPSLNSTLSAASFQKYGHCGHLTVQAVHFFVDSYLTSPDEPKVVRNELRRHPEVSALFAPDPSCFPPTLLLSAECDPVIDDTHAFEAKLAEAGVSVRHVVYPQLIHGFWSGYALFPEAQQAMDEACRTLREHGVGV